MREQQILVEAEFSNAAKYFVFAVSIPLAITVVLIPAIVVVAPLMYVVKKIEYDRIRCFLTDRTLVVEVGEPVPDRKHQVGPVFGTAFHRFQQSIDFVRSDLRKNVHQVRPEKIIEIAPGKQHRLGVGINDPAGIVDLHDPFGHSIENQLEMLFGLEKFTGDFRLITQSIPKT